ncbi:glycoside hydrolase family 18 [Bacteroides thetaiotaomicron]|uniref:glycoside hydrolase family 18 n=1 Tax=Bacteroides thetaiotaomicron TaxID=818 RepID=UPI0039C0B476
MKMLRRLLYILPVIGIMIASCVDIESKDFEHIGGYNTMDNEESAQYYADLRAWKATSQGYGRPIFFGWFSNWSPEGPIRKGYLASLPDSIDMVSMWSGPFGLNEAKLADKEIFQKRKAVRSRFVTFCIILELVLRLLPFQKKYRRKTRMLPVRKSLSWSIKQQKLIGDLLVERKVLKTISQPFNAMPKHW